MLVIVCKVDLFLVMLNAYVVLLSINGELETVMLTFTIWFEVATALGLSSGVIVIIA